MTGEWIEAPLPEVIDFREGPGILAKEFRDEGTPLVRLSGLDRGSSLLAGCNYLDPSDVAARWGQLRLFYERLVGRGKSKKAALAAVARKLLIAINAMMRDHRPWQPAIVAEPSCC
jgi:hypothetical protein